MSWPPLLTSYWKIPRHWHFQHVCLQDQNPETNINLRTIPMTYVKRKKIQFLTVHLGNQILLSITNLFYIKTLILGGLSMWGIRPGYCVNCNRKWLIHTTGHYIDFASIVWLLCYSCNHGWPTCPTSSAWGWLITSCKCACWSAPPRW